MLIIEVCVGSSCYLRGAPEVIASLQKLIAEHAPGRIEIKGTFCLEKCTQQGVTVRFEGRVFPGVEPGEEKELFEKEVMPALLSEPQ